MAASAALPPPDPEGWCADPVAAGFDPAALAEAARFAASRETAWPVDLRAKIEGGFFEPPPFNEIVGPVTPRGGPNGLVLAGGRLVARWGDTRRVDMTFSVAKSYLSLLAGIALGDGLIGSLDEPVGERVRDGGFESPQNRPATWRHLLQQSSEWEGALFGKPDSIDRNRAVGQDHSGRARNMERMLRPPGTHWEYNDIRVNRLSLALLHLFGRPLPEVFAERITAPIGASATWRWKGYRNSAVTIGGRQMISVPGGGHWGGGVFIHAEDQARIALLAARDGCWGERRLLPEGWMTETTTPCGLNPSYGLLWWLNTGRTNYPAASPATFFALGTGGNISLIEPAHDIVIVTRWIDGTAMDELIARVIAARNA